MIDINNIREHSDVIGSDGRHIGTVDHADGDRLKLTKSDSSAFGDSGHHHYIQRDQIDRIEEGKVVLNVTAADLRQSHSAEPEMAGASTTSGQRYSGSAEYAGGSEGGLDQGRGTGVDDQNRDSAGRGNFAGGTPGGINTGSQNMSGTMGADGTAGIGGGALGEGTSGGLGTGRDKGF